MKSTIDFEEFTQLNNELLNNAQLFNRPGRQNKHFRLNARRTSVVEGRTPRPNSITLTPRQAEAVKSKQQFSTPRGGYDVSLPKLPSTSSRKEHHKIDRNFLQQWLNSALEDAGGKGPLRGVRKYQVDKRHLLGQNIPMEDIDKLYHSLYIYSYGFGKVLSDLLNENETMVLKFWRVFLKLIQQTSEYDNLFAVVERKHMESLQELKRAIQRKDVEIQELKAQSEEKLRELVREVGSRNQEIKDLKVEKFVLESNFELTDEAFNDEVALRLRFEEKINAINTAYGQLKMKYARLVEDIKVHREGTQAHYSKQKEYINEKATYQMRILELQKIVETERERMKLQNTHISEIRQELFDLKQEKLAIVRQENEEEVELKTAIIRERKTSMRLAEESDKREATEKILQQQAAEIDQLKSDLQRERKNLEEEYMCSYQLRQDISQLKKNIEDQNNRINTLEMSVSETQRSLDGSSSLTTKQQDTISNLQRELQYNKRRVMLLEDSLALNQKTIEGLRDAKDKHEKMYRIIQNEQEETMKSLTQANKHIFELEEDKKGWTIMLQTKDHANSENENRLKTDLEIARNKIQTQASQLGYKDNLIIKSNDKIDELKNIVTDKNYQVDKLQKSIFDLQSTLSTESFDKKNLERKCKQLEETTKVYKQDIERLNLNVLNLKKNNAALSNDKTTLSYVIDEKKKLTESETEAMKGLVKTYKQQIESLLQNIHPMHYWDKEAQVNRLQEKINPMLDLLERLKNIVKKKEEQFQSDLVAVRKLQLQERNLKEKAEAELTSARKQISLMQEQLKATAKQAERLKQEIVVKNSKLADKAKEAQELSLILQQAKAKRDSMKSVASQTLSKSMEDESVQVDIEIKSSKPHNHKPTQGSGRNPSREDERRNDTHSSTKIVEPEKRIDAAVQTDAVLQSPELKESETTNQVKQSSPVQNTIEEPAEQGLRPQNIDRMEQQKPQAQRHEERVRAPIPPSKPITNKQFSKALKFTFMRK